MVFYRVKEIPAPVLLYIAKQIHVDPEVLSLYAQRKPTDVSIWRKFAKSTAAAIFQFVTTAPVLSIYLTLENENTAFLITSIPVLRKQKIILPAMQRTIERMVWESRNHAEKRIFKFLNNSLTEWQKEKLDSLIDLMKKKTKHHLLG